MPDVIVGVDVGTTAVKAVAFAVDGQGELATVGHHSLPTPWRVAGGQTDADPDALVAAALAAATGAVERAGSAPVAAVGVAGMAEAGALVAGDGRLLGPVLAWHDPRGGDEIAAVAAALGGTEEFVGRTGVPCSSLPSIAKVAWLRTAVAAARRATDWRTVPELVVGALGGTGDAERSQAARTGLVDLATGDWWSEARAAVGLPPAAAPVAAGTAMGRVTEPAAGPLRGAVLTAAGHDHQAALVGVGATGAGDLFDSFGTAEAVLRSVPPPLAPESVRAAVAAHLTVGAHVIPGRLCVSGGTRGGLLLATVRSALGADATTTDRLDEAAGQAGGPGSVMVRGAGGGPLTIEGVAPGTGPGAVWYAAVLAAAAALEPLLAELDRIAGPPTRLVAAGGWLHSTTVRAVKEIRLGPIVRADHDEPGCFGAARLAAAAAGVLPSPFPA